MLGDFYSQGIAQLGLFDDNQPKINSAALTILIGKAKERCGLPDEAYRKHGR